MQKVPTDRVVIGFDIDDLAIVAVVIPVQQHAAQARHKPIGNVPCARGVVVLFLGEHAAQCRYARSHDIHWVGGRRQRFQHGFNGCGNAAQGHELALVASELCLVGKFAVDEQISHLFELTGVCEIKDVVATIG